MYHEYLCVSGAGGNRDLLGSLPYWDAGKAWPLPAGGSPGEALQSTPEEGLFGTCKKISDKSCVDKCVMKSFDSLRANPPNYQLFNRNGGQNCHKWAAGYRRGSDPAQCGVMLW